MILPLRQVINFAMKKPAETDSAYKLFFGDLLFSELKSEWEELFLEWLIFDFKRSTGMSFLIEYILKNPDNLDVGLLSQLKQAAETQHYSQFVILNIKKGQWIEVEDLFTGKIYLVYEKKGSEELTGRGIIPGRVGKIDNKWYLVGANSVYFPITYTERAKKLMRKLKTKNYSPRDTVDLLRSHDEHPSQPPLVPTKSELKEKRNIL